MARPSSRQPCGLASAGVARAHGDAVEQAWVVPVQPDGPPAAVEGRTQHRVHARVQRAGPGWRRAARRVTWGVSMPICRPGPPTQAQAASRRSAKVPSAWATTSNPSGSQGPGRPSSARTSRSAPQAATASSVSAKRGGRDGRRLDRAARRAQPGLDSAWHRLLGHHQDVGASSVGHLGDRTKLGAGQGKVRALTVRETPAGSLPVAKLWAERLADRVAPYHPEPMLDSTRADDAVAPPRAGHRGRPDAGRGGGHLPRTGGVRRRGGHRRWVGPGAGPSAPSPTWSCST